MDEFLCWYALLRFMAAFLNSPIVIAILSLSFGGVVASKLASIYQLKQQIFQLRVQGLKLLLDAHANWVHTHLSTQERETHKNWMQLITTVKYAQALFPGPEIENKLASYFAAASELGDHFGQKIDAASIRAEDEALHKLQTSLNELSKVLVSRLGIPAARS
jgi:hypothetical protein